MLKFTKMHGLGNDFIVIDLRHQHHLATALTPAVLRRLADRRLGIGCDQIMIIDPPSTPGITADVRIYNQDGSSARACGNGTRCVAYLLGQELPKGTPQRLRTCAGELTAIAHANGQVSVDMGPVSLAWQDIPLAQPTDTAAVPIHLAHIHPKGAAVYAGIAPVAVNVGNPHIVFFITNMEALDIHTLGPLIENDPLFPDRVNVSFAEILNRQFIRAQVWERGTGSTLACGSAACAMAVAGHTLGLTERQVTIEQPGGQLSIKWLENSHVDMTGPTTITFEGMTSNGLVATT